MNDDDILVTPNVIVYPTERTGEWIVRYSETGHETLPVGKASAEYVQRMWIATETDVWCVL